MREIFNSHPVSVLKKEISKTNIKGYSKMKKAQIVDLMMKNKERFKHIKMAKKPAPAQAKKPATPAKKPATPPPKKKKIKLNVVAQPKGLALKRLKDTQRKNDATDEQLKEFLKIINKLKGGVNAINTANRAEDKPFGRDIPNDYIVALDMLFHNYTRYKEMPTQKKFDEEVEKRLGFGKEARMRDKMFKKFSDLLSYDRPKPSRAEVERKTDTKEEFNYVMGNLKSQYGNLKEFRLKK
jgi:hypothetical protein